MPELLKSQQDARVKVIFTLAFILFLALSPLAAWGAYFLFLSLILAAAIAARMDLKLLLRHSLLSLVFVISAVPLLFTGPDPLLPLHLTQKITVWISQPGLLRFISICLKAWISMLAALYLSGTSSVPELLLAFKRLRIPRIFIAILSLMWRYLFVIREEARSLMHARASRSAAALNTSRRRGGGTLLWRAKITGGMAGNLLLRSLERADRVYAAMLSRGYTGELPDSGLHPLRLHDWLTLAGVLLLLLFFFVYSLLPGL